ncbi:hypothetical protein ACFQL4_20975 [Halosimplex aquaticum]
MPSAAVGVSQVDAVCVCEDPAVVGTGESVAVGFGDAVFGGVPVGVSVAVEVGVAAEVSVPVGVRGAVEVGVAAGMSVAVGVRGASAGVSPSGVGDSPSLDANEHPASALPVPAAERRGRICERAYRILLQTGQILSGQTARAGVAPPTAA